MRKHYLHNVASIRAQAPIEVDDDELLMNLGGALGGRLEHQGQGRYLASTGAYGPLNPGGELFNACYGLRSFAGLRACAACVLDLLMEQLDMQRAASKRLEEALEMCANKLRADDIRAGLESSHELDTAVSALAFANGESEPA